MAVVLPVASAAMSLSSVSVISNALRFDGAAGLLLDTRVDGAPGGTGRAFDWSLARGVSDGMVSHCVPPLAKRTTARPFWTAATVVGRSSGIGRTISAPPCTSGTKDPPALMQFRVALDVAPQ